MGQRPEFYLHKGVYTMRSQLSGKMFVLAAGAIAVTLLLLSGQTASSSGMMRECSNLEAGMGALAPSAHNFEVYNDPSWSGGWCYSDTPMSANIGSSCNNKTSSVKLVGGWSVRLYNSQNQSGSSICFNRSDGNLNNNTYSNNSAMDNTISSFTLYHETWCGGSPSPAYPLEVYNDASYSGSWCYSDEAMTNNIASSCNDKVTSILLRSGWSIRVYRDTNQNGPSQCLNGSDSNLSNNTYDNGSAMNNTISSFVLYDEADCGGTTPTPTDTPTPPPTEDFCIPTAGTVTQRASSSHMALDIAGPSALPGNPVYAAYDGDVVYVGRADLGSDYRHAVAINHGYIGAKGKYVLSFYVHMGHDGSGYATVNVGDSIQRGQLIGYQGDAGIATGVHLHWEVHEFDIPFLDQYTHWGNGGCKRTDLWYEFGGGGGCGANPQPAEAVDPESYTGSLTNDVTETCSAATPDGYVDSPKPGATVAATTRISGWAKADGSTIDRVEIWIDGIKRGNATYGIPHPDAGGDFGWYWDWDTTAYGNGSHSIQAKAVAANGKSTLVSNSHDTQTTTQIDLQNVSLFLPLIMR